MVAQWLEVFGQDRFGANARAYLWHVFSFERYPSLSGVPAQAAYDQQQAHEYIVLSNDRDVAFKTDDQPGEDSEGTRHRGRTAQGLAQSTRGS